MQLVTMESNIKKTFGIKNIDQAPEPTKKEKKEEVIIKPETQGVPYGTISIPNDVPVQAENIEILKNRQVKHSCVKVETEN